MNTGAIRMAGPDDLGDVMTALRALAADLGDPFRADDAGVHRALFGPMPYACAMLAPGPLGIALCSPVVSTTLGQPVVFVSDLWVSDLARGQSLGRRLLAAAMRAGRDRWGACALRLNVYRDNVAAQGFYRHLGFQMDGADMPALLSGPALAALLEQSG